jgi:protein-S-isoprenylcysteine O-methyltransferase Ste14
VITRLPILHGRGLSAATPRGAFTMTPQTVTLQSEVGTVIGVLWIVWLVYWWASAIGAKKTRWHESLASALSHRVPLYAGVLLLVAPARLPPILRQRWLAWSDAWPFIGLGLVMLGLGFTVVARTHLGRNWSGSVTLKEGHALIRTGPYEYVRHPIYTGLLLAFAGVAVAIGQWRGLLALAFAFTAFVIKSRIEEGRMRATFAEYADYSRHTRALIPFVF